MTRELPEQIRGSSGNGVAGGLAKNESELELRVIV
jgi:hypothetical protein